MRTQPAGAQLSLGVIGPVAPAAPPARPAFRNHPPARVEPADLAVLDRPFALRPEHLASFKALGVEICIHSPSLGDLWLVPDYTGKPRREVTPEHAATLAAIVQAFPGARPTSWVPLPS